MTDDWREQNDAAMALQSEVFQACRTTREIALVGAAFSAGLAHSQKNWRLNVAAARAKLAAIAAHDVAKRAAE